MILLNAVFYQYLAFAFPQCKSADWNSTDTVKLSRLKHQTELAFRDTHLAVLFETEHSTLEVLAEMLDRGK